MYALMVGKVNALVIVCACGCSCDNSDIESSLRNVTNIMFMIIAMTLCQCS